MRRYILLSLLICAIHIKSKAQITEVQIEGPSSINVGQQALLSVKFFSNGIPVSSSCGGTPVNPPCGGTYDWTTPSAVQTSPAISSVNLNYATPGTYTVYYTFSELGSYLYNSKTIQVLGDSPCLGVLPSAPGTTLLANAATTLTANPAPSGFTYQWYDSNQTTLLSSNQIFTTPVLSSGKTYHIAYRHTATGCITAKIPVKVNRYNENQNWIRKYSVRDSIMSEISVRSSFQKGAYKETTYYDGLGRPMQIVNIDASANGGDIITPIAYDALGRQHRDYLPFPNNNTSVNLYRPDAFDLQSSYHSSTYNGDTYGYAEKQYEASPLNRVLKQSNPGSPWRMGSGREFEFIEKTNAANEAVRIWTVDANGLPVSPGEYAEGSLWRKESWNENEQRVVEYFDKLDRLILKKVQLATPSTDHTGWLCTYNVYDDFGRLSVVIPPQAVEHLATNSWTGAASTNAVLAVLANGQYSRVWLFTR